MNDGEISSYSVLIDFIPGSTVQQFALEVMETGNIGPLPVVQSTGSLNQDIAFTLVRSASINVADLGIVNSYFSTTSS